MAAGRRIDDERTSMLASPAVHPGLYLERAKQILWLISIICGLGAGTALLALFIAGR